MSIYWKKMALQWKGQEADDTLTITDADYADDIVLLANTEFLLHNQKKAAGFQINADKTDSRASIKIKLETSPP